MKTLKIVTICIIVTLLNNFASAQCAELYIYRTNGFQNKKPVMLFQNGEQIATINPGERYKANVCTQDQYQFVVRTSEGDLIPGKVDLELASNQQYYLKVACAVGVELASIKLQNTVKGNKEVNNGSKFIGAVKALSVKESGNSPNAAVGNAVVSDQTFQRSQVIDNFKFDVVNITKAGEQLTLDYKITNLAVDDRKLATCPNMIYFYDDLGNLLFPTRVSLANSQVDFRNAHRASKVWDTFVCYDGPAHAIMPSGIPLKGQIVVGNINTRATKFVRANMGFKSEIPFDLEYRNLEFPLLVDDSNPNKRNFGAQSLELIEATKDSIFTYVQFKHTNNGTDMHKMKIKSGLAYDDLGNQHEMNALAWVSLDKKVRYNRFANWQSDVNANSAMNYFGSFDGVPHNAIEFRRVTLTFEGFSLSWENVPIKGSTPQVKAPGPEYLQYAEFETKVRNQQDVVGNKVILENIYFTTASDKILQNSYPQLNQLGQLMGLYNNLKVEVSGHTDDVGDDTSNMLLSQKRADAIKYYLISKSINPERIGSVGKGEKEPISENSSDDGRQQNRRVEITVIE